MIINTVIIVRFTDHDILFATSVKLLHNMLTT